MSVLVDGINNANTCIFAHGAGAPMDSAFMEEITKGLVEQGIKVIRFEFPYMQERRQNGKKRPPNRQPELIAAFADVLSQVQQPCVLMGKSMGGRMASIMASLPEHMDKISGVIALGYPFHPQNKPEKLRVDHLSLVRTPMLIMQGTRDALGNQVLVETLTLPKRLNIQWLEDGDHDLKPRVKSGFTHQQHLQTAIDQSAHFIKQCYLTN